MNDGAVAGDSIPAERSRSRDWVVRWDGRAGGSRCAGEVERVTASISHAAFALTIKQIDV